MINIANSYFYVFSAVLLEASHDGGDVPEYSSWGSLSYLVAFFNAAGLFVLANAEFLALMLVVVYVGAVAVLFLFVVMMLNVELGEIQKIAKSIPYRRLVGGGFAVNCFSWLYLAYISRGL